jgi:hypothetical protein
MYLLVTVLVCAATAGTASELLNPSFEVEFGSREDLNMWGDYGEAFGECYQVYADGETHPDEAPDGDRALLINVPFNSWNGIWQQIPWEAGKRFVFSARYLVRGGDLEGNTATFLKVEFYDMNDAKISEQLGNRRTKDTRGNWLPDSLQGVAPPGTASMRFIIIGGSNPDGAEIANRIYWDDAQLTEAAQ